MLKISVIIPAYNESNTIEEIVRRVQKIDLDKEIVIVDDGSNDGTRELIESLQSNNIKKAFHKTNLGKGAAIRTALKYIEGDIVVIQDADLEYHPDEYNELISPILEGKADVVFGSRFIGRHRCFLFTHYLGNKIVNLIANIFYNTNLSDMMTGYKAFRKEVLKDIHLKANRFGFEAEITGEVFKRHLSVYEVPISYSGRTYEEGKKITWKNFFEILYWLIRTRLRVYDISFDTLNKLAYLKNYSQYFYKRIEPFLGQRILEVGCGTGNITKFLLKQELVIAIDNSVQNLDFLRRRFFEGKKLKILRHDIEKDSPHQLIDYRPDSVLCINVLEHIENDKQAMKNITTIMGKDSRCIILVPAHKRWLSQIDLALGHFRRYDEKDIVELSENSGLSIERLSYLNALSAIGWWFNFRLLRRKKFSSFQLFLLDKSIILIKLFDRLFKNFGLNILVVCRK